MITTEKITNRIKKEDKARNFTWIFNQFQKGRLLLGSNKVTSIDSFNQFREAVKTVQDIYEGYWDLEIEVYVTNTRKINQYHTHKEIQIKIVGIVLYFPTVLIKNRDNNSHNIKDLFVLIPLDILNNNLYIDGIRGTRMTISYAEYCSHYLHSHLSVYLHGNTDYIPSFTSFCTGSGEINMYQADINSEGFTVNKFIPYLLQILTLVSYESIEGTPYRRMRDIMIKSSSGSVFTVDREFAIRYYNTLIDYYKNTSEILDIEFSFNNGKYEVVDNAKFESFLTSIAMSDMDKQKVLCMKDETGTYYKFGSDPNYIVPTINYTYIFQGKEFSFIVEDIPEESNNREIRYFIHPEIKKVIKKRIEYDINKTVIRESTIKKYSDQSNNA